jgi:hypothetical protein
MRLVGVPGKRWSVDFTGRILGDPDWPLLR